MIVWSKSCMRTRLQILYYCKAPDLPKRRPQKKEGKKKIWAHRVAENSIFEDIMSFLGGTVKANIQITCVGVIIFLNVVTFSTNSIQQRYEPPHSLAGRYGAVRLRNYEAGQQDIIVETCYAPTETSPTETKEECLLEVCLCGTSRISCSLDCSFCRGLQRRCSAEWARPSDRSIASSKKGDRQWCTTRCTCIHIPPPPPADMVGADQSDRHGMAGRDILWTRRH